MPARTPSFADFDARARGGEQLTIVFLGGSLTWGANATDPATTSYRALIAEKLFEKYPHAPFKFFDAAIGGTGSQLAAFRLQRDVLRRKPDLVFLDFSANDGLATADADSCSSYEAILRRLIEQHAIPVVQLIFPFKAQATAANTAGIPRRDAHLALAAAYHTAVGDAITFMQAQVQSGRVDPNQIWTSDPVHPGDAGYALFAEVAWNAFVQATESQLVCRAPANMIHADTYMHVARARLAQLYASSTFPPGWSPGRPNLSAAFHDALMSRWLDDVAVAGKATADAEVAPLRLRFRGRSVLLFGEETLASGQYRIQVDGVPATRKTGNGELDFFDASSRRFAGNRHHVQIIATGLSDDREHTLDIIPILLEKQELRLESVCVAGPGAQVEVAN